MAYRPLTRSLRSIFIFMGILGAIMVSSCNEKDDPVADNYISTESVAITNFSLSADLRVMKNLDSVYFSIDLEHGVVFNADSLPKGTNITKLIPKITYPTTVTSAVIEMKGGTHREGTTNYYSNANDTIDFTGDVTLTLGTNNNAVTKTYTLKVNVHKEDPDTMYWASTASANLPSRLPQPVNQKTVAFGSGVLTMIEESDGSFTVSTTKNIFEGEWSKQVFEPYFTPHIESLVSVDNTLYMIGDRFLMESSDGLSWQSVSPDWEAIIAPYGNKILGRNGNRMISYPEEDYSSVSLPASFPEEGFSNAISLSSRWDTNPMVIIFGGKTSGGQLSNASWAFDGKSWVNIADNPLPALEGLSVVKYYSYLNSAANGLLKEFEVYLAFGGTAADGSLNRNVYITYDHGISWMKAQPYMQLPDGFSTGYKVDALTLGINKESLLSDRWKSKKRLPFEIEGDVVKWDCPYIFLFGGYDSDMKLNSQIRSGVLQRLTFVPLF